MQSQRLKMLLITLCSVLTVTGVNGIVSYNTEAVYAAQTDEATQKNAQNEDKKVDVKVTYNNENSENSIDFIITITNESDEELNLKNLNLKYNIPQGNALQDVFENYYAGTCDGEYRNLTDNVQGKIEKSDNGSCADISFNGGNLDKGQSMSIQGSIHDKNWESRYGSIDKSSCTIETCIDGKSEGSKEEKDSKLLDKRMEYMPLMDHDKVVKIKLNGNKLSDISLKKYEQEDKVYDEVLKEGKDYDVEYNDSEDECTVIIKEKYLKDNFSTESWLKKCFQFNFSGGNPQSLNVDTVYIYGTPRLETELDNVKGIGDNVVSVPLDICHLGYFKGIISCSAEIQYDPDQVEVVSVKPSVLVDKADVFEYKDDSEKGIVKIDFKADSMRDVSKLDKATFLNIEFKNKDSNKKAESSISVRGHAFTMDDPDKSKEISGSRGQVKFIPDGYEEIILPELSKDELLSDFKDDRYIEITENGNKFLGIEGFEEGKDYTYKNGHLTINSSIISSTRSVYLKFENNIKKIVSFSSLALPDIDYYNIQTSRSKGICGGTAEVPVNILTYGDTKENVISECGFKLKYDTDAFEDVSLEPDPILEDESYSYLKGYGASIVEKDKDKGIITIKYKAYNDKLPQNFKKVKLNLLFSIKKDSFLGDTRPVISDTYVIGETGKEFYMDYENAGMGLITIDKD